MDASAANRVDQVLSDVAVKPLDTELLV